MVLFQKEVESVESVELVELVELVESELQQLDLSLESSEQCANQPESEYRFRRDDLSTPSKTLMPKIKMLR